MSTLRVNTITNTSGNADINNVGKIINVVQAIKSDTASYSVGQGLFSSDVVNVSYAAASSSNKLLLRYDLPVGYQHGQSVISCFSLGGSPLTASLGDANGNRRRATSGHWLNSQYQITSGHATFLLSSPSTSSTTYGVQVGQSDNATQTVWVNRSQNWDNASYRSAGICSFTLMELAA